MNIDFKPTGGLASYLPAIPAPIKAIVYLVSALAIGIILKQCYEYIKKRN